MMGAIFMKFGRAPAMRSITSALTGASRQLNRDPTHFKQLFNCNRRRMAVADGFDERGCAGALSLVLSP